MANATSESHTAVLKRVNVSAAAKVMGTVYAGLGLLFGALFSLFSLVGAGIGAAAGGGDEAWLGVLFGVGAIVVLPLFYGTIGTIAGAVGAAIYNLAARLVGGLEFELESAGGS